MASKSSKRRRKRREASRASATGTPGTPARATESSLEDDPDGDPGRSTAPRTSSRRPAEDRPPAPWGSFPLIELTVFIGIVMLLLGLFAFGGDRQKLLIGTGLLLGSIGGLDQSIREHWAGYRSHTLILSGVPALVAVGVLYLAGPSSLGSLPRGLIALAVFGVAAALLVRLFRARSGGDSFKLTPSRRR